MSSRHQDATPARGRAEPATSDFGLPGIAYVLGGGFPDRSVYLLTGDTGSFFATFAQQALYNAVRANTKVVYYTSESSSQDVQQDMGTFKWDIEDQMDSGAWVFARMIPPSLKTIVSTNVDDPREQHIDLPPNSLMALQRDFVGRLNEGRWSALSLSYLMKTYSDQDITELVLYWVNAAHRLGGVHFILIPRGIHDEEQINYIKSLVDGVLSFKFAQGFEQAEGEIDIEKMRRVVPRVKTIRHSIQDDGLAVETTARVG